MFYSGDVGHTKISKMIARKKWFQWLKGNLSLINGIDVIHACDYDTGAIVRIFSKNKGVRYVYDIYDYYVDAHPVPKLLKSYIEKGEIDTIENAEFTIICTEERREQIKKAVPKKLVVIHNSPEVMKLEESPEEYDYVYCGSLYDGRLIKETLDEYPNHEQLHFVFAGYGEYTEIARKLAVEFSGFEFLDSIPYAQVLEVEMKSKVISALYDPRIRNHQLCAPNKFYEALALGKPLIVCKGTGIDRVVEKENIGYTINYDVHEFYDAINKLVHDPDLRKEMGYKARKLYESKYRWELMKERLISAYMCLK